MSLEPQADASTDPSVASSKATAVHAELRELYAAHCGAALKLASSLLRDRAAAEDVTHEAFVRLNNALQTRPEAPANLRSYLLAIVRNLSLKELRRRGREAKAKQGLEAAREGAAPVALDRGPLVQRALDQLSPDLRAVLLLRHVHELPYAELIKTLELSERTIRNRLRTAAVLFARQLRRLETQEDA